MSEHVRIEDRGSVLAITLARPERRNAITVAMYTALAEAVEQASSDNAKRLITIAGEGQDFAAGNDLADFLDAGQRGLGDLPVLRMLRALVNCEVPIAAAVHGNCVGIGTTMLLHCDFVIAEASTRFSLPFVDLALVPEAASTLLLPRLAGQRRAARYLMLGEPFGAEEALEIGLASHVSAPGELEHILDQVSSALLAKPPEALRQTRELLRHGTREELLGRIELESRAFGQRLKSQEVKDAITAFFERRSR
jgi:enoyl-CoA hydratase/carnithine racemase